MSNNGSPRSMGEIDTRPPFQSVKAALNLFVEVSGPNKLSTRPSFKKKLAENVMDKETQLMLAHRQLNKIKHRLESAEAARLQAIPELERANRTLRDLTAKLEAVTESKLAAEAVKDRAKKLEVDKSEKEVGTEARKKELETTRNDYAAASAELDESKKELSEIRRNFDATLEAKHAAFQAAGEAHRSANSGAKKARELSGEISVVRASSAELTAAARQAAAEKGRLAEEQKLGLEAHWAAIEAARRVGTEIKAAISEIEAARGARESNEQRLFEVMKLGEVAKGARRERDEVAKGVQVAEKEIVEWKAVAEAAERSLVDAVAEAEEARAKEKRAVAEMTIMSLVGNVRLSAEAFESLSRRAEAAKRGVELKEAESEVLPESTNARKIEAEAKREANLKAIEEIKTATDLALRSAEMSDSAKNVVENELRKWRREEQLSGQLLY